MKKLSILATCVALLSLTGALRAMPKSSQAPAACCDGASCCTGAACCTAR